MPELKPHSWAQSGSPTSTILNRIREHNIEFGGSPARVAHIYDVPLYEIPADQVLVPRELLERVEESLRSEIEERYAATKDHPAIRPKYLRDIAEVDELRALLQS